MNAQEPIFYDLTRLTDNDIYLFNEGSHFRLYEKLGSHPMTRDTTEGTYFANQPSYRSGNLVKNVMLTFRNGSLVKVKATSGQEFARKQFAMDKGANKVGEFSLTDKRFSKIDRFMANTLFDENFGGKNGNCHVALGSSYSDTFAGDPAKLTPATKKKLGFNDSALHWDLVNTEDKVVTAHLASGKNMVVYEKGMFTY